MFRLLLALVVALFSGQANAQLAAPEHEAAYRAMLPNVTDPAIRAVLADPFLILYTDREMPPAYQGWEGIIIGVHSPFYNISAGGDRGPRGLGFGNANREFPWSVPAGTHDAKGVGVVRFLHLPREGTGRGSQEPGLLQPVVWWGDNARGYQWSYPVGAVFGEVLYLTHKDRGDYTFELRVRIRAKDRWNVNVYRPFPTAADLSSAIKSLRPKWTDDPALRAFIKHLAKLPTGQLKILEDNQVNERVFQNMRQVDSLPPLDESLVAELLSSTPFSSALRKQWKAGNDAPFAPTTDAEFHVVPRGYAAGHVAVSNVSCARCHDGTGKAARRFDAGRDWYGRVRGSDGIFSFHPFAPASISRNGFQFLPTMNAALAGIVERFDGAKHPADVYTSIPGSR